MVAVMASTTRLKPMTRAKLREHVSNALQKALKAGVADTVKRLDFGHYLVPSTSRGGVTHVVTGRGKLLDCTCEAGGHLPFCVHRGAVAICRLREEGYDLELGPDGVLQAVRRERADDLVLPITEYPQWVGE
jgi:hypothetical protein